MRRPVTGRPWQEKYAPQALFAFLPRGPGEGRGHLLGGVQGHGGADERLQRLFIDRVALADIDGAPDIAFEAGIEEARRIFASAAPLAKVSFTTALYVSPVQMMPSCSHTGTPRIPFDGFRHFTASIISGSASPMSAPHPRQHLAPPIAPAP